MIHESGSYSDYFQRVTSLESDVAEVKRRLLDPRRSELGELHDDVPSHCLEMKIGQQSNAFRDIAYKIDTDCESEDEEEATVLIRLDRNKNLVRYSQIPGEQKKTILLQ